MVVEILELRLFFLPEKPEMSPGEWCQLSMVVLWRVFIIVDVCFVRSTYYKNVPTQCLNLLSLNLTKE